MALVALYLGHNVVVVGDHEQVSPSAIGQEAVVIQNLIDQFLRGIPNAICTTGKLQSTTWRGNPSAKRSGWWNISAASLRYSVQ